MVDEGSGVEAGLRVGGQIICNHILCTCGICEHRGLCVAAMHSLLVSYGM